MHRATKAVNRKVLTGIRSGEQTLGLLQNFKKLSSIGVFWCIVICCSIRVCLQEQGVNRFVFLEAA